jgi:methylphosphotriester-DNA--protein-cysteine methyltransferase
VTTTATPSTTASSASAAYVGNSNTHKFHLASCRYVSKMSEDHKVYFNTRDEAIAQGYVPCKVCNP